jgi:hypothetical protein
MIDAEELLREALAEQEERKAKRKRAFEGKMLHGVPDWQPVANVWLKSVEGSVTTLIGLFVEHRAKNFPSARRFVRADAGLVENLPERIEEILGPWPYDASGQKWERSKRTVLEEIPVRLELDSEGLHTHAAKEVMAHVDFDTRTIAKVTCGKKLELSNFDHVLWIDPGTNIWPILDRECKKRIHDEIFDRMDGMEED